MGLANVPDGAGNCKGSGEIDFAEAPVILRLVQKSHPVTTEPIDALKLSLEPINAQLYAVEERIRGQARAFDPAVEGYVAYAIESSGKRLRPAAALLAAGATGNIGPSHLDLAVVVELIHAATLIHDDILDGADKRRGQPSANAKWGNAISVLLGDCLFAHALKLSTSFQNAEIGRRIAQAASEVCSGEIIQTQRRFDLKLSVPDYYKIIEMKTGALFAAATELGALLNEAAPEVISAMRRFGLRLGTAYQVYDDVLDLAGEEILVGKTLGTDLRKGKLTLPILHLLQISPTEERDQFLQIILSGDEPAVRHLVKRASETGAVGFAVASGRRMLGEAMEQLAFLPPSRYRESLASLCDTLDGLIARFRR
jgi:octaprenyl-diphosphate synthase